MTAATLRFIATGLIGFLVDAAVLAALLHASIAGPAVARLGSFLCALLVTWMLNRSWSFAGRQRPHLSRELSGYATIQVTGFAVNYGIFLALVHGVDGARLAPLPALIVGCASSAVLTYSLLNWRLYRARKLPPTARSISAH
ncbi:MAG TPA: GtrA family protein [Hyphomicrobium sp.]|nr:GtrA family protein [Hyphomicrobium sp.]